MNEYKTEEQLMKEWGYEVYWSSDEEFDCWSQASKKELFNAFMLDLFGSSYHSKDLYELEEKLPKWAGKIYLIYDDEANPIDINEEAVAKYLNDNDNRSYDYAWDEFRKITKGIIRNLLNDESCIDSFIIIDGERAVGSSTPNLRHYLQLVNKGKTIRLYKDSEDNIVGWYALPSDDRRLYNIARRVPQIINFVRDYERRREEIEDQLAEHPETPLTYYTSYEERKCLELHGKELWLEAFKWFVDSYVFDRLDFSDAKQFLIPIKIPFERESA